jgi:hypothetical protein
MALQLFFGPLAIFQFLDVYKVGRTPWTVNWPVGRPLPAHRATQTQNKRTQTSMLYVGFEHTTPMFELAKTVYALERVAIVIDTIRSQ